MIDGLLLLFGFQLLGELLHRYSSLPLPAPVIGMLLLFLALLIFKAPLSKRIEPAANGIIKHLTLIYFPIGVGLILNWSSFSHYGTALIVSVILSTLLSIPLIALLSQWLLRGK